MNTPFLSASSRIESSLASPSETRKRPKPSPRRAFSGVARAFATLVLATCAFGAAASAQTLSISPPPDSPGRPDTTTPGTFEGSGGGTTNFNFTVTLDSGSTNGNPVTVRYTTNNGTATASTGNGPGDFLTTTGTLTFPAGAASTQTISVPVTADDTFERNEQFSVTLSNPSANATIGTATANATIVNDDNPPQISIANAGNVTEGNTGTRNAAFVVTLSAVSGQDVQFNYSTIVSDPDNAGDGTTGGQDFIPQTNQIGIIQAGATTTTINVPVVGDTIDEANGQFQVEISNIVGADLSGNGRATATIIDDDGPTVTVSSTQASEGDGQIIFRITLSKASPQQITVNYRTGSSSARVGSDYGDPGQTTEITGSRTFDAFQGNPSDATTVFQDVPIPLIDDQIIEPTEIFSFTIVSADDGNNNGSVTVGGGSSATGTILDDDGTPNLTVAQPAGVVEGNTGANRTIPFVVSLDNISSRSTTFNYRTVEGTATSNVDFRNIPNGAATIPAGQKSVTVNVTIIGDTIDEPDETVGLIISNPLPSGTTIGGQNVNESQPVFATIIDDDGPNIIINPTARPITEGDAGTTTSTAFTVQLSTSSPQPVTVDYALGTPAGANEATLVTSGTNGDYRTAAQSGTLTFPANTTTVNIPITIIGDNVNEPDETITLTLSGANGGNLTTTTATITIVNDDNRPTLNLEGPGSLNEGSGGGTTNFVFRARLDRPSSLPVTANFTVNNGTATAADNDFTTPTTSSITINAGSVGPVNIVVPVVADNLDENDETFSVTLSGVVNANSGVLTQVATIKNDDAQPTVSITGASGLETGDPPAQGQMQQPRVLQFGVSLNRPSGKTVVVTYSTTGAEQGVAGLTALPGADFTPVSNATVTIPAGSTTPTNPIAITVVADTLFEANETFNVNILNATNARISGGTGRGTIIDDDGPPNVKITAPTGNNAGGIEPYSLSPDGTRSFAGRNVVFPVTISAAAGRIITVNYYVSGSGDADTSADSTDFKNPTGTIVFRPDGNGVTPTTQFLTLMPRGDDGNEPATENFAVNLTTNDANFAAVADATAAGTLADRDPQLSTFAPTVGFGNFDGTNGTTVTFTGDQFITDGIRRVQYVRFSGPITGSTINATSFAITATTVTINIPELTYSSFPSLVLFSDRALSPVDDSSAGRLLYVQPHVDNFSPQEGVSAVTPVIIRGHHFRDPRNPVVAVRFGEAVSNARSADRGISIDSDTQITAYPPRNSTGGPISIETQFGGRGPGSNQSFTINGANQGGLDFIGADTTPLYEDAIATIDRNSGGLLQGVRSFTLRLKPATQNNGDNTPLNPRRNVDIVVSLTPSGGNSVRSPEVILDQRGTKANPNLSVIRVGGGSTVIRIRGNTITSGKDRGFKATEDIPLLITDTGDDNTPPNQTGVVGSTDFATGITPPVQNSGVNLTLRAEITNTQDPDLYPNGQAAQLTMERRDIIAFAADIGTTLRTNEDQTASNNTAVFPLNLANLNFPNPGLDTPPSPRAINPINPDAAPEQDVTVTLQSSDVTEGLITYYVLVGTGANQRKVYPGGAVPKEIAQVIYAKDPNSVEYYGNRHFIQVVGQDDDIADPDTKYQVVVTSSSSTDAEYNNINFQLPFSFVNTDNEQTGGNNSPGYTFSRGVTTNLNTNEDGSEDFFTTFLNTQPTGDVKIRLTSGKTNEVVFVDPKNPNGAGLNSIVVTYLRTGTGNPSNFTTNYNSPLTIRVRGVDDDLQDGDQNVQIITTVVSSTDPFYRSIDPPNLTVINADNESNGVTLSSQDLTINEGDTQTFSARLNSRPTSPVTITLSSSDTSVAVIVTGQTLTFNNDSSSSNYYKLPHTVTVRGVSDGTFTAQRTATIVTSNAISNDPNYRNLAVNDVTVTVLNSDPAFIVSAPSGGLSTSESGKSDSFTVSLGQQPNSNVTLNLSVSPASEARLSATGSGTPSASLQLVFNSGNYANPQTVTVTGQDDSVVDGNVTFTITGRVVTSDTNYQGQSFTPLTGVNADNDSGSGGGGNGTTSFGSNTTYTVSFPYASTTAANSTLPISSLFTTSSGASTTNFKIYRFNVSGQQNSRVIGEDFVLVPNSGSIQRGLGYILQTGSTPLTLKTPSTSSALKSFTGTSFSFTLSRNNNFTLPNGSKSESGYNFIGFPFNPSQFTRASFSSAKVSADGSTYSTVREAAAAGVISNNLYTMDSSGNLVQVPDSDQYISAYKAYFVKVYRDSVTLTLTSPSN